MGFGTPSHSHQALSVLPCRSHAQESSVRGVAYDGSCLDRERKRRGLEGGIITDDGDLLQPTKVLFYMMAVCLLVNVGRRERTIQKCCRRETRFALGQVPVFLEQMTLTWPRVSTVTNPFGRILQASIRLATSIRVRATATGILSEMKAIK